MKKTEHTNINLDELFAGARTEEPVINIDEARSILHTKAGQPHATRPAHEFLFSQPLKLFAIMTPAIGLLCLGLYLYLGKPMEQKQFTQISENRPHTAAKSISAYKNNEESTSPFVADTLKTKSRIIINDRQDISGGNFKVIELENDSVVLKDSIYTPNQFGIFYNDEILVDKNLKFDSLKEIRTFNTFSKNDIVFKRGDTITRALFDNTLIERRTFTLAQRDKLKNLEMILKRNPDAAYKQVDSFVKAVHPDLKNNYTIDMKIAPIILGSDKDIKDKILLYKLRGKADYHQNDKEVKNQAMQFRIYVDQNSIGKHFSDSTLSNKLVNRLNIGSINHVESVQEYKNDSQNVKVITLVNGKDINRNRITENAGSVIKLNSVPFLELDDETLNKLGIVYNDYKVYYHGEINKAGGLKKSAITLTMSPCFPPCDKSPDTALTSNYAMRSKLKSTKRDFFPIFTSDRTGTDFRPVQFEREKLTNRAEFLKQANSLVPVIVKTNRKTFNMEDVVFWFAPTDEFFNLLPENVGKELSIEYKKLNQNTADNTASSTDKKLFKENKQLGTNDGTGENCKYFEVCRTNSGAISTSYIYPNPASTQFNLVLGLQGSRNIKISLLDIQGKLIRELAPAALKTDGRHNYSFQVDDINRGVYLVLIESDQGEQSIQRLVIDK